MARRATSYIISGKHEFGPKQVKRAASLRVACAEAKDMAFGVQSTTKIFEEKSGKEVAAFRWDERDVVVKRGRCPGPVLQSNRDGLDGSRRRRAR